MAADFLKLVAGIGRELGVSGAARPAPARAALQSVVSNIRKTPGHRNTGLLSGASFKQASGRGGVTAGRGSSYTNMLSMLKDGTPGVAGHGGFGAIGAGFMTGGITANWNSDSSQRGVGTFIKGGLWGAAGGGLLSKGLSNGALNKGAGNMLAHQLGKSGGQMTAGVKFSEGAWRASRLVESAGARKYAFASGAMLAGGFMGGDRSRAHGFNANRGNRFSG